MARNKTQNKRTAGVWAPRFGHNDPKPGILLWFLNTRLSRRRLSTRFPIVFRALGLPRLPAGNKKHDVLRPQNGRDLGLFLGPPGPPKKGPGASKRRAQGLENEFPAPQARIFLKNTKTMKHNVFLMCTPLERQAHLGQKNRRPNANHEGGLSFSSRP